MTNRLAESADIQRVMPWQGNGSVRHAKSVHELVATAVLWLALACVTATVVASEAHAAESAWPTAQATAANAEWVPYLDPPPKPAAICLVDSGVNVTPDTPADNPDGPIVKRLALDGGTGEAAGTSWEALHGTRMAMVAGAPKNDWGTIGMWPGVRIVSVRAMPMGEAEFSFDIYAQAISVCRSYASKYNVVAINLSLSCGCTPSDYEAERLENVVTAARTRGLSVVAAAGNSAGAVGMPASTPGVVAVSASSPAGSLCPFSNTGAAVALSAPGCGMSLADPSDGSPWTGYTGATSAASIEVSVALALLRAYQPGPDRAAAERGLIGSTTDQRAIDVRAAIEAIGTSVHSAVTRFDASRSVARESAPRLPSPQDSMLETKLEPLPARALPQAQRAALRRPRFRMHRRPGSLIVRLHNRPRAATATVRVCDVRREFGCSFVALRQIRTGVARFRIARSVKRLRIAVQYRSSRSRSATVWSVVAA